MLEDFPDCEKVKLDLATDPLTNNLFREVSIVVHIAAITSSRHPHIRLINVDKTAQLVDLAKKNRVQQFLYISSETAQLDNQDAYGQSKAEAEKILKDFEGALILRPTVILSLGDKKNIGFLIHFIKKCPLVPLIGSGKSTIQPVYVGDVVSCMIHGLKKSIHGTYLIAGARPISYIDIVRIIIDSIQRKRIILHIPVSLAKLIASMIYLLKLPQVIQKAQIDNLKQDRRYDMAAMEQLFSYRATDPEAVIRQIALESQGG